MTIVHKLDPKQPHPIEIGAMRNEPFDAWDLNLMIGNFKTKDQLETFARKLVKVLKAEGMHIREAAGSDRAN